MKNITQLKRNRNVTQEKQGRKIATFTEGHLVLVESKQEGMFVRAQVKLAKTKKEKRNLSF